VDKTGSAHADYPGYRVDLIPSGARVRVWQGALLLADSRSTLLVEETAHWPVIYFPEEDVERALFEPSDHRTGCASNRSRRRT